MPNPQGGFPWVRSQIYHENIPSVSAVFKKVLFLTFCDESMMCNYQVWSPQKIKKHPNFFEDFVKLEAFKHF